MIEQDGNARSSAPLLSPQAPPTPANELIRQVGRLVADELTGRSESG